MSSPLFRLNQYSSTRALRLGLAAAIILAAGCAGEGFRDELKLQELNTASAFPLVERSVWGVAPAGCEGMLQHVHKYGIATLEPELVVGFDSEDRVVCVDTYASVERELDETAPVEVDGLWLGYVSGLQNLEADGMPESNEPESPPESSNESRIDTDDLDVGRYFGDPTPQPSIMGVDFGFAVDGDPSPQPSNQSADTTRVE